MYTTLVSAHELKDGLGNSDCLVIDCRFNLADTAAGELAYQQAHIPNAFYLHLDRDLSSPITPLSGRHPLPAPEMLSATLQQCGVSSSSQIVVYDDCGGMMAARCWWLLRWLGHQSVAVLNGGLPAWVDAGFPIETDIPCGVKGDFVGSANQDACLSQTQLKAFQIGKDIQLIDARAAERFAGKVEPIDPVAGHIPNALNRPLMDNLDGGFFKPAEQLRDEWLSVIDDVAPTDVVHMCGSGVTACHNLLAMEHAGLSGSRVYPGSWSEWIRDPQNPVTVGD